MPPEMSLRRISRGRYATRDGRFVIESDTPGLGEWDDEDPEEWFVYRAQDATDGRCGPPDALYEAPTLRQCRQWVAKQ